MNRTLTFYSMALCVFSGCQTRDYDKEFIENYGDESFGEYVNTLIYFRSLDERDNLIYFFNSLSDNCEAPYLVTIDKATKKAARIDFKLRKPACDNFNADTITIKDLVERFLKYKVNFLKVDKDTVVYVNVDGAEETDLVKLPKYVSPKQFKNFKYVKGNWYSKERKN